MEPADKFTYKHPIIDTEIYPSENWTDLHSHTSYSDGSMSLVESIDEAKNNGIWEKGPVEHGNTNDEDIDHLTTFLENLVDDRDQSYTSLNVYPYKFETIKAIVDETAGATTLTDADTEKLQEDIETLKGYNTVDTDRIPATSLNYTMVVPHGVEMDYNPAIEFAEEPEDAVESYEEGIIEFLKEAESVNCGYNYILLSSHYVNTPFQPRYVKKPGLFKNMSHDELGEVLEHYKDKEISKIESLSSKLGDMSIPAISEELMYQNEIEELENFVHDQSQLVGGIVEEEIGSDEYLDVAGESAEILRPGVFAVGAHPTLIERNEVLMDYFREEQGLTTKQKLSEVIGERLDKNITRKETDGFLGDDAHTSLYPDKELKKYYENVIEAAEDEENFIFEINGKGIERQDPSVFWNMLGDHTFGSDSHRHGEQPSRSMEFNETEKSSETVFLSDLWLSQLEKDRRKQKDDSLEKILDLPPKRIEADD